MTPISQTRRDLLKGAAALAAVASVGAGEATMPRPARSQGSTARIDGVLRQAADAREVPGVVAIAATPGACSTRARSARACSSRAPPR